MVYIKDKRAMDKMRMAGKLLAGVMIEIPKIIKEGVSTLEVNDFIENCMRKAGLKPSCIGYKGYKHATCISVNSVVVHGVPSDKVILQEGDLVKVDVIGAYKNYCVDMARCYFVGVPSKEAQHIVDIAQKALDAGIKKAIVGNTVADISRAIEKVVESEGFGVVRDFAGHGVGKLLHEEPEIPNFVSGESMEILRAGMTLAIEPMITEKGYAVVLDNDGWTARTMDGGLAGHVEDTVLITEKGTEILTRLNGVIA